MRFDSLGRSLCDALDEMVHHGQMTPPLANEILLQVSSVWTGLVDSNLAGTTAESHRWQIRTV
jgi:hypothetical protein